MKEWTQLRNLGLLTHEEVDVLRDHCDTLRKQAIPSFLLIHWSMKYYRKHGSRVPDLDKTYVMVLKFQEEVVKIMELPMPFQYFHIMNLMLMLNLGLWSYSLALEDSYFASLIFFFVQLMFQGLRELSVALSDPFGDDATDFPLNKWMTTLYLQIQAVLEDGFDLVVPEGGDEHPLPSLRHDECIIELLVDDRVRVGQQSKNKFRISSKVAPDLKGDYTRLPQKDKAPLKSPVRSKKQMPGNDDDWEVSSLQHEEEEEDEGDD